MSTESNALVVSSYAQAPTRTVGARGVTCAYRELRPKRGTPIIVFVHLAATLDNWDPRVVDHRRGQLRHHLRQPRRRCQETVL